MSHKKQNRRVRTGGQQRDGQSDTAISAPEFSLPLPVCQAIETPKSLDEQLAQAEAQLEAAQTDDEWVEIFLQWIDLHEQKMAVTQ